MDNSGYKVWYHKVNRWVLAIAGLDADELPDCQYRAWYDSDIPAREAARMALENAGYFIE